MTEPGTPEAMVEGMFLHAERLGHSPVSAKHALTFFVEEIERLEAENDRLRELLQNLVIRLNEISQSSGFKIAFDLLFSHGYEYDGPSWEEPLREACAALNLQSDTTEPEIAS